MSFGELAVLVIVALVVMGPKELPKVMRKLGQWSSKVRRMASDLRAQSGIDEVLSEGSLGSDIAEIRKLARGEIDGVMRVARFDPMPSSSAAAVGAFSAAAMPQPEPYAEAAFVVRAREWPREGADSYGALPDTAVVYADHFPRSALADDALYMTGEPPAPEGAQGLATA